jgi:hypothetical protein
MAPARSADVPDLPPRPRSTLLTLRHVSPTCWSVTSGDGHLGGTFTTQKAALHYAREEALSLPRAVLVVFGDDGLAVSETYEAHARVRVAAIATPHARAA